MDILMSIASKVGESLVKPAGRQLGYLIFCEGNIKALEEQTKKLEVQRAAIQLSMNEANTQLEVISPEVIRWVSEVDKIMNKLGKFLEEDVKVKKMCFNGWCPNLKLRHSLGRKAKKNAEVVMKHQQEGKFHKISYPAPPTGMHLVQSMKAFDSRTKILNQVMEVLKDEHIHTIAICGMGGIGKTTMAKEVARRAREGKLFGYVVMAVVAQNPNVTKIQGEIADTLGLKFNAETELGRAGELRSRIQGIEKILIILDDIWARLDLEAVGIPSQSEHPRCTVLLTSRNEEVARTQMNSQRTFIIEVLSENEAWNLFEEVAGTSIENPDLLPIAKQIANECKGLPVAIITVGSALKNRDKDEWNDALHQLRKSIARNISAEVGANVYSSIELSYTFLRSEEAKSCFLLCCLFPEDHDIPIETLVRYGKGLRLFQNYDTIEVARKRVHTLVQTLKRCFLLLDSDKRGCVKLHDVVRDVAISISSDKEHGFVVRCDDEIEEWPEIDSWENCTTMSLVTNKIKNRLDSLVCPKLKLLHLSTDRLHRQEFNENFFRGMEKLQVLAFCKIGIQSLPSPLQVLQNMRTLHLEKCVITDISSIGALVKLEILSLFGSEIQELPREIGHLQHLKLLDVTACKQLKQIPPGVLSSLSRLEELYMSESFNKWSPVQGNNAKICASLDELISLSDHLKVLEIHIPSLNELISLNLLGQCSVLFNNLTRFMIAIPKYDGSGGNCLFQNYLRFEGDTKSMIECGIHLLLNKCERLELVRVKSLKNVTQLNEGFSRLKVLSIEFCEDVEYLINLTSKCTLQAAPLALLEKLEIGYLYSLKGLCHPDLLHLQRDPKTQFQLFCNLTSLYLGLCSRLKYVFSASIARGSIPQLQSLVVRDCGEIEGVVYKETEENNDSNIVAADMIVFPKLARVSLVRLKSVISLYRAMDDIDAKLVPFKCINWLPSLQSLVVSWCDKFRVVFDFDGVQPAKEKTNTTLVAAPLNDQEEDHLHGNDHHRCQCLGCLPVPTPVSKDKPDQGNNTAQKKSQDEIVTSPKISHSDAQLGEVRSAVARDDGVVLHNLETVYVGRCKSVGAIFDFGEGQGPFPPVLNNLNELTLYGLPGLMDIWKITKKGVHQLVVTSGFKNLRVIRVDGCERLRCIFSPSIAKLLVMLQYIHVADCESMEAVIEVAKEGDEEEEDKQISFPHLRSIHLSGLGNLSCFCEIDYAFRFPSLEMVQIWNCPKLKTFVKAATMSAEDITPMLQFIGDTEILNLNGLGGLNTAIHRYFQLKREKLKQLEEQNS